MPRGMDERFENPSKNKDGSDDETDSKNTSRSEDKVSTTDTTSRNPPSERQSNSEASSSDRSTDDSLNIREDWDPATIYVEPEQSEDIEITFTRLKKQLKRDGHILEKNKHFYRAIFEIAFDEHREETKQRIRELVKQETATNQ